MSVISKIKLYIKFKKYYLALLKKEDEVAIQFEEYILDKLKFSLVRVNRDIYLSFQYDNKKVYFTPLTPLPSPWSTILSEKPPTSEEKVKDRYIEIMDLAKTLHPYFEVLSEFPNSNTGLGGRIVYFTDDTKEHYLNAVLDNADSYIILTGKVTETNTSHSTDNDTAHDIYPKYIDGSASDRKEYFKQCIYSSLSKWYNIEESK